VTCDSGLQKRKRTCTDPEPYYGGDPCVGETWGNQTCHPIDCPGMSRDGHVAMLVS